MVENLLVVIWAYGLMTSATATVAPSVVKDTEAERSQSNRKSRGNMSFHDKSTYKTINRT
jgi:hypothetical protein